MRILIDPPSVESGASRLIDTASELAQIETRLRSTALPSMPPATAAQVSAAIDGAGSMLRSIVIDYVSIGQELRVRSQAIRGDALSWLTSFGGGTPAWFTDWFVNEIVRKGVSPFNAAWLRDTTIGRLSHVLTKHPGDLIKWFTNVDHLLTLRGRELDRVMRWVSVLGDPLERAAHAGYIDDLAADIARLQFVRAKWTSRIQALGRAGMVYGLVTHALHSEANTKGGKVLSTGINFLFTRTPQGAALDLVTAGGMSTSADFYAITAEALTGEGLVEYKDWTEANLRGDNGYLFRIAAQIPENGEYLADYTYDRWTWFPVDPETGETRVEWRPWKWDDPPDTP